MPTLACILYTHGEHATTSKQAKRCTGPSTGDAERLGGVSRRRRRGTGCPVASGNDQHLANRSGVQSSKLPADGHLRFGMGLVHRPCGVIVLSSIGLFCPMSFDRFYRFGW